jgi:hypothetical protein
MNKKDKDNQNEYIGIVAIVALVLIAVGALYFYFSHRAPTPIYNSNVPVEATPVNENDQAGGSK